MKRSLTSILLIIAMLIAAMPQIAAASAAATAIPTASTVLVDGKNIAFDAYTIDDFNYFKLRDLAYVLNGSAKQFEVGWDEFHNAISLKSNAPYTAAGGEMTGKGAGSKKADLTNSAIYLNGRAIRLTAYNIEGNNYFKLRDVGITFDFDVVWDEGRNTIVIDTDKSYSSSGATTVTTKPGQTDFADKDDFTYADLAGISFVFASGVGAWMTEVIIQSDGSFRGEHWDSDMGDDGPGYPNGTQYYCNFSGKFSPLIKVGPYEYTMRCESMTQEGEPGETVIAADDGIRYIISESYGFDDADIFYLYLPGRKVDDLPEMFLDWVSMPRAITFEKGDVLEFYGLYNAGGETGFSGG